MSLDLLFQVSWIFLLINVRKGKVAIRVRGKLDLIRLVQRRACNLSRNCFEHERKALCVLVDVLVQGKLGLEPNTLEPDSPGPNCLGPVCLGPDCPGLNCPRPNCLGPNLANPFRI